MLFSSFDFLTIPTTAHSHPQAMPSTANSDHHVSEGTSIFTATQRIAPVTAALENT